MKCTEQAHHWKIEPPGHAKSRGVCKHCGAVKWFTNFISVDVKCQQKRFYLNQVARELEA